MLCTVSKDFREAAEGDGLWQGPYMDRFCKTSRAGLAPTHSRERETADEADDADGAHVHAHAHATPTTDGESNRARRNGEEYGGGFKKLYMKRMQDPHVSAWGGMETPTSRESTYDCELADYYSKNRRGDYCSYWLAGCYSQQIARSCASLVHILPRVWHDICLLVQIICTEPVRYFGGRDQNSDDFSVINIVRAA